MKIILSLFLCLLSTLALSDVKLSAKINSMVQVPFYQFGYIYTYTSDDEAEESKELYATLHLVNPTANSIKCLVVTKEDGIKHLLLIKSGGISFGIPIRKGLDSPFTYSCYEYRTI